MSTISVTEDTIEGYKYWFRRKIVTKMGYKKADAFNYDSLNEYFEKRISVKESFNTIFNIKPKKTK